MVKIGLLGVGHLGKIHLKCLQAINSVVVTGFYDPNNTNADKILQDYPNLKRFSTINELITQSDAVDIVTPTITHFELAAVAIKAGKHVFIEKPLTHTLEEAEKLVGLATAYGVKVQVGYVERFNPAFLAIQHIPLNPLFIEAHRLAMFNPRGTDVSVVLDLMVHDLDLILKIVKAPLKSVEASGVAVVSTSPDMKQMRKLRLFQKEAYISIDLLEKQTQIIQLFGEQEKDKITNGNLLSLETEEGKKYINIEQAKSTPTNAIQMELEAFSESIRLDKHTVVTIADGYQTLQVAHQIIKKIEERKKIVGAFV